MEPQVPYAEAVQWIDAHAGVGVHDLTRESASLAPEVLAAMKEVIARGTVEQVQRAALVLTMHGVLLEAIDGSPDTMLVTFPDGRREIVTSASLRSLPESPPPDPDTLRAAEQEEFGRLFRRYAIYTVVVVALAVGAWLSSGGVRLALAILAGLLALVTLWSVLVVGGLAAFARLVARPEKKRGRT